MLVTEKEYIVEIVVDIVQFHLFYASWHLVFRFQIHHFCFGRGAIQSQVSLIG
jgi:hypothetical protein